MIRDAALICLAATWMPLAAAAEAEGSCSAPGEDCRRSRCCTNVHHRCYSKNAYFAACRANCTPGIPDGSREHWSCERLGSLECAWENKGCKPGACCTGLTCYEKDSTWSGCKRSCEPGVDPLDPPHLRSPWSCRVRGTTLEQHVAEGVQSTTTNESTTTKERRPPVPSWDELHCSNNSHGETGLLHIDGLEGPAFAQGGGGELSADGRTFTLRHDSGYSVMSTCRKAWAPDEFVQLKLLGRTISFVVDLSRAGCGCNLAFYLIGASALDSNGEPSKGECKEAAYYCDANRVCGQWCPEIDIMEANNHAFQATPHKCEEPSTKGHYSSCDREGCAQSTRSVPNLYGPGPGYTIDTRFPFNVSSHFPEQNGQLTGMKTTLAQGSKTAVLDHASCKPGYLAQVGRALSMGMSLRITYWGQDAQTMGWLDQPPCGKEACTGSNAGDAVISSIRVNPPQLGPPIRRIPGFKSLPKPLPFAEPTSTTTVSSTTSQSRSSTSLGFGLRAAFPLLPVDPSPADLNWLLPLELRSTTTPSPITATVSTGTTLAPTTTSEPQASTEPSTTHGVFLLQRSTTTSTSLPGFTPLPGTVLAWRTLAVGGGLVGFLGALYLSAVLLVCCFPALLPAASEQQPGLSRAESALSASGTSSRQLLAREKEHTSGLKWAAEEVNKHIGSRLCCGRSRASEPEPAQQA